MHKLTPDFLRMLLGTVRAHVVILRVPSKINNSNFMESAASQETYFSLCRQVKVPEPRRVNVVAVGIDGGVKHGQHVTSVRNAHWFHIGTVPYAFEQFPPTHRSPVLSYHAA